MALQPFTKHHFVSLVQGRDSELSRNDWTNYRWPTGQSDCRSRIRSPWKQLSIRYWNVTNVFDFYLQKYLWSVECIFLIASSLAVSTGKKKKSPKENKKKKTSTKMLNWEKSKRKKTPILEVIYEPIKCYYGVKINSRLVLTSAKSKSLVKEYLKTK